MEAVKNDKSIDFHGISDTPKPEDSLAFGRKLKVDIPSITVSGTDIDVFQIKDPDNFLPQSMMKSIDYLNPEKWDKHTIKNRIVRMRTGRGNICAENRGLIYWEHIQDQQVALKEMAEIFDQYPIEVVVSMERGGTFLYDTLKHHLSQSARPIITLATAKEFLPKHREIHIKKTVDGILELSKAGYNSFAILDVTISGGQLFKIIKTLNTIFRDDMPEVHLLFLKQSLTEHGSAVEGLDIKIERQLAKNPNLNMHFVTTPFIIGEDVHAHLSYGMENQYPVNVILPDKTVWKCKSPAGTRETLINILSGKVNTIISSLYAEL